MLAVVLAAAIALVYPQARATGQEQIVAWSRSHPFLEALGRPLGAHDVFVSWWFLAVAGLLFVNGSICLMEQIRKAARLNRKSGFQAGARMMEVSERKRVARSTLDEDEIVRLLAAALEERGLAVRKGRYRGHTGLLAVSNSWAQWGTVLFHAGLLLTLVFVVLVALTAAEGQFRVVEGGGFKDGAGAYGSYGKGPLGPGSLGGYSLTLRSFEPLHRRGSFSPGPASDLLVVAADGTRFDRRKLTRGEYFTVAGTNIFQNAPWGFAPVLRIGYPSGKSAVGAVMMRRYEGRGASTIDRFDIRGELKGTVQLLDFTQSVRVKPRLKVSLFAGERRVLTQVLSFGQTKSSKGFSVTYDDFKYWTEFLAIRNPWLAGVNLAFWLLIAGASIMYVWPSTYAWSVVVEEDAARVIYMGGRRERFSKDFAAIVEGVKHRLESAERRGLADES